MLNRIKNIWRADQLAIIDLKDNKKMTRELEGLTRGSLACDPIT
jgi:hypothetical protein